MEKKKYFIVLFASQIFAGVLSILFASGRIAKISDSVVVTTLLFIQWQTFGLTIAKLGLDQIAFSVVSKSRNLSFYLLPTVGLFIFPLSLLYGFFSSRVFDNYVVLVLCVTLVIDSYSLIKISELNAKEKYCANAISSLANYPLFYGIIFVAIVFFDVSVMFVIGTFFLTSAIRFIFIISQDPLVGNENVQKIIFRISFLIAIQQILNYWMFRGDQILVGFLNGNVNSIVGLEKVDSQQYLFLAKFPEFMSSFFSLAASFIFSKNYLRSYKTAKYDFIKIIGNYLIYIVFTLIFIFLFLVFYCNVYAKSNIKIFFIWGFYLQVILILPVNMITFSMLRRRCISVVIRNLLFACFASISFFFIFIFYFNIPTFYVLQWMIVFQMIIYMLLSMYFDWGKSTILYE